MSFVLAATDFTLLQHPRQERMGAISHTVITEVGVFGSSADCASAPLVCDYFFEF